MSMRRRAVGPLAASLAMVLSGACSEKTFDPPDRDAQVAQADSAFSMSLFDSIDWASDTVRAFDGNVVYATYCRNCHGPLGAGGTEYARNRQLEVPSLVQQDWRLADSRDSILHRIFVGHASGMPTWGVAGITLREMDAVTYYVTEVLRPEVVSGG
jgi:mono/diheme cytochrome c family protein